MNDYAMIIGFVEGGVTAEEFEQYAYGPEFESLTSGVQAPPFAVAADSLYSYAIAVNYRDPGATLSLRGVLGGFLAERGVFFEASGKQRELHGLLLSAQPSWLDLPVSYLAQLAESSGGRSGRELKTYIKDELAKRFRCLGRKPSWLQSPEWPFTEAGEPMVFAGQIDAGELFHDTTRVYVFIDPRSRRTASVTQSA